MARIVKYFTFWMLLTTKLQSTLSFPESRLFDLVSSLKDPVCPSFVVISDDPTWNEEMEKFYSKLSSNHQKPITVLSSDQSALQACKEDRNKMRLEGTTCNNVVVFSRYPEELKRIYRQLSDCLYLKQIFIISEMNSDLAGRWLTEIKSEIIILILQEREKNILMEIKWWMINNEIRSIPLLRESVVSRKDLGLKKKKNLMGSYLRVATLNFPPVVFIDKKLQGNTTSIYGIEPALMEVIADNLNFSFGYFPVSPNEMWGSVSGEGDNLTATGLLGALINKKADVALGNLYIDYTRLSIIGFTSYYKISEECFSVPASRPYPKWTALYHPFSGSVWIATFLSILMSILTLCFVATWSKESSILDYFYRDAAFCFLTICASLFGVRPYQATRSMAGRLFLSMWLFGALILSTGYRSGLISFMMLPFTPPPIGTMQQLVDSSIKKIIYDPLMKEILIHSNNSLHQKLGRQIITNDNLTYMFSLMNSSEWAVDANLDNLRYVVETQYPMTSTGPQVHLMKECIFSMRAALGLQKASQLKSYFDRQIKLLIEAGLVEYHRSRFAKPTLDWNPTRSKKVVAFSLDSLQGAFYSFAFFVFLSVLIFLGEFIHASFNFQLNRSGLTFNN